MSFLKGGQKEENSDETKVCDAIYDYIYFEQLVWDLIDTPHFQRLRKIKQLACLEYVYPCATHTRFDHSIGTAHLAKTFLETLIRNNPASYKDVQESERKSAIRTVTIAGLLHELGQGPFSRTFDRCVRSLKVTNASIALFRHIMKLDAIKGRLSEEEQDRIITLMRGVESRKERKKHKRPWELDIISNELNSIDVDKFDYFRRDATHVGAKNIYVDHDLLFEEARIIDDEICYPTNIVENVYNIFHSRYKLYKMFYFDVVNKAIEQMVSDILYEIKDYFDFEKSCQDIEDKLKQDSKDKDKPLKFLMLNDNILEVAQDVYEQIKTAKLSGKPLQETEQNNYPRLERAVGLMKRIRERDLYKFVHEIKYEVQTKSDKEKLYTAMQVKEGKGKEREQQLQERLRKDIAKICQMENEDIIFVMISEVGLGTKDKNPLMSVGLFKKEDELNNMAPKRLNSEVEIQSLSMLYTNAFIELSIKFYIKKVSNQIFNTVKDGVDTLFKTIRKKFENEEQMKKWRMGRGGVTPGTSLHSQQQVEDPTSPLQMLKK